MWMYIKSQAYKKIYLLREVSFTMDNFLILFALDQETFESPCCCRRQALSFDHRCFFSFASVCCPCQIYTSFQQISSDSLVEGTCLQPEKLIIKHTRRHDNLIQCETLKRLINTFYRPQMKFGARQCFYSCLSVHSGVCLQGADPPETEKRAVRILLACFFPFFVFSCEKNWLV